EHDVLGGDALAEAVAPFDQDGARHLQPDLAGGEHAGHFGGADAEHVAAEGAAGRRMAVAADHQHAGPQMTALRQDDVAYALAVMEGDLALARPLPRQLEDARAFISIA